MMKNRIIACLLALLLSVCTLSMCALAEPCVEEDPYDLSYYGYRTVSTGGRGALVFQQEPCGKTIKGFKFNDGDRIYVNLNYIVGQQYKGKYYEYTLAYCNGTYGYVDASYISWSSGHSSQPPRHVSSVACSLMNDVDFYSYYPDFETFGATAVGRYVNSDGTWTWETYFQTADPTSLWVINCDEYVSLRAEADTSSERLMRVPLNAKVNGLGYTSGWVLCQYNGACGWIRSDYLSYQ